jgi:hypothetical protein
LRYSSTFSLKNAILTPFISELSRLRFILNCKKTIKNDLRKNSSSKGSHITGKRGKNRVNFPKDIKTRIAMKQMSIIVKFWTSCNLFSNIPPFATMHFPNET